MRFRMILTLLALMPRPAAALDVCSVYGPAHARDITKKIASGIPFRLLSVAVASDGHVYRKVVRIKYDLWDEIVTITPFEATPERARLSDASAKICAALSLPEAPPGPAYSYRLLLNPVDLDSLKEMSVHSESGLIRINWERVMKDLETEKALVEHEFR